MTGPDSKQGLRSQETAESAAVRRRDKEHLDELLDEALDETFPASDAIALNPGRD